jgi:hypothetical protein
MKQFFLLLFSFAFFHSLHSQDCAYSGVLYDGFNSKVESAYWCVDTTTRTLKITGNGVVYYTEMYYPWSSYIKFIEHIIVSEGVTKLDNYVFYHCEYAKSISLPSTLTSIGRYTFSFCNALTSITIPENVTYMGGFAFYYTPLSIITFLGLEPPELPVDKPIVKPPGEDDQYHAFWGISPDILVPEVSLSKYQAVSSLSRMNNNGKIHSSVSGVSFNPVNDYQLHLGDSLQLSYTVSPSHAYDQSVAFVSADTSIASVSNDGVVTAHSLGNVFIHVHTLQRPHSDSVLIVIERGDNTFLSSITPSHYSLQPAFSPDVSNYTITVPYDFQPVSFSAVAEDSLSKVTVSSNSFQTVFTVESADSRSVRHYTVSIYRLNNEARFQTLLTTAGQFEGSFRRDVFNHTLILPASAKQVDIEGITLDPNASYSGKVTVFKPSVGLGFTDTVVLTVLAEDVQYSNDYTIVCRWKDDDSYLKSLSVEGFPLIPDFSYDVTRYAINLPKNINSIMINAQSKSAVARVSGDGWQPVLGNEQIFSVSVRSEDGNERSYYITAKRESSVPTSVQTPFAATQVYVSNGIVSVETPFSEFIRVYSTEGTLLYQTYKQAGLFSLPFKLHSDILVVRGSTGWVQKLICSDFAY